MGDRVEQIARIIYEDSFGAHNGGADWDRTVERAIENNTTYCATIIWRTLQTARKIVASQEERTPSLDPSDEALVERVARAIYQNYEGRPPSISDWDSFVKESDQMLFGNYGGWLVRTIKDSARAVIATISKERGT